METASLSRPQISLSLSRFCKGRPRIHLDRPAQNPIKLFGFSSKKLVFRRDLRFPASFPIKAKLQIEDDGFVLEDVPHLTDFLPSLHTYPNPLKKSPAYAIVEQDFVNPEDVVSQRVVIRKGSPRGTHFRRAGPREKGGYRGFYSSNTIPLSPKSVNDIHKRGGTILGTSRGGHDTTKIVDSIQDRGINQVYIIGGDGTQKGASVIYKEIERRGLKVSVAGIPKTIDNDITVIDKSFGFDTAVEEAQRAINAAHVEAESVDNGLGIVKLMGRYSGFIAMYATLASRDVDCCLIPESPFYLEGEGGLFDFIEKRLKENGHMVVVLAEGAGQELVAQSMRAVDETDASGNQLLHDVGLWLAQNVKDHFTTNRKMTVNLKYVDPTYMIRAIPSNASDNIYCTLLAHGAVHGAMAGYTGFTIGPVNNRHAYIPTLLCNGDTEQGWHHRPDVG
ncbi:ATP-dependent 6-phosphofructokinase 4, chloroplastic isoform X3 [Amborella trichopoda]|uniref:ATP-dependent 6-phosphofructokinase 4, chloroplastic isoform X3 n=1 Tax=Amborella trichopoda TaxID=13333 RepID=UPI0009BE3E85|nr:ATP-dependent 6-phosphofructokinase 4, chloroplastic isoform X3 [Amborella trichopoda]|eukprot:XP_020519278.1 ATP-dependent 6-phosphofructokinase 4, chloroplastic isoform X3 [Amborella trichopoda]